MIAIYAMGAGLGHLTRVRAALHTLGRDGEPTVVLTDSRFATDRRVVGGVEVLSPPDDATADPGELASWVGDALRSRTFDEVWVDAFPGGIRGELSASVVPADLPIVHLARLLQWPKYSALLPTDPVHFDRTYLCEPVTPEHHETLAALSHDVLPLALRDPVASADLFSVETLTALPAPRWLIAHAGPEDELLELVSYARDLADAEVRDVTLVVAAPHPIAGIATVDTYPVWPLFAMIDRVITAAGFNSMRQASALALGDRHRFLPFPRRHDDQFERARRARESLNP